MGALSLLPKKVYKIKEGSLENTGPLKHRLDAEIGHGVGVVETKYFHFALPPEGFTLESGEKLGPITVAYETYGKLNDQRSNAILALHALSGDAHAAGFHEGDEKPGWWDDMIGPGKAFDTNSISLSVRMSLEVARGPRVRLPSTQKQGSNLVWIFRSSALRIWSMCKNI